MAKFIELTCVGDPALKIFVNIDTITTIQQFDNHSQIVFNFSIPTSNGGIAYDVAVVETASVIIAKIKS